MLLYPVALLVAGAGLGRALGAPPTLDAHMKGRVFELRTYTAPDGKLSDLHTRFRNHTLRIFEKHGMTSIGYWMPQDAPLSQNTLIYLLAHPSREAARKNWADFAAIPSGRRWPGVPGERPAHRKIDSVFIDPTDYSPMK